MKTQPKPIPLPRRKCGLIVDQCPEMMTWKDAQAVPNALLHFETASLNCETTRRATPETPIFVYDSKADRMTQWGV